MSGELDHPRRHDALAELAGLLGLRGDDVASVVLARVDPTAYAARFADELLERGIDGPAGLDATIALADRLEAVGRLAEHDWKEGSRDVLWRFGQLVPVRDAGVVLESQPDDDARAVAAGEQTVVHAIRIAAHRLAPAGLAVVHLVLDSDSYPMVVVPGADRGRILDAARRSGVGIWSVPA